MKDHLTPELRQKVNYLRNYRVEICNDKPGGYLFFTVATSPRVSLGCGRVYGQDEIDEAIAAAEKSDPATAARLNQQLRLFP